MAAPTTVLSGSAALAATGEDNGLLKAISPRIANARLRLGFSGTFTGATVVVRGRTRGINSATTGGVYYPLQGRNLTSGAAVTNSGSLALTDSTPVQFEFEVPHCDQVEVYASAGTLTAMTVEERVEPAGDDAAPIVQSSTTSSPTFATVTADAIAAGDSSLGITGAASGGAVALTGGANTGGAGGAVTAAGGTSSNAASAGGAVTLTGGTGGAAGAGGAVSVVGGVPASGNAAGGAGTFSGGAGSGTGAGGAVATAGGASGSGATGNGGAWAAAGGAALSTNGTGGAASVVGGVATGTGTGGALTLRSGASAGASGTAGAVVLDAGAAAGGTGAAVEVGPTNATSVKIGGAASASERAAIKGVYVSGTIAVAVPSITDPDIAKVDADLSGMTFAPAVGDMVVAIPLEALPSNCRLQGAWISATDTCQITFGSEGGNVTGASKNFKFLLIDLT